MDLPVGDELEVEGGENLSWVGPGDNIYQDPEHSSFSQVLFAQWSTHHHYYTALLQQHLYRGVFAKQRMFLQVSF